MGKTNGSQTVTQTPDQASQEYINRMREIGAAGIEGPLFTGPLTEADIMSAMSPYLDNVIGGVRGEYDHLRDQSLLETNDAATRSRAFGGSRHAIMAGARMGELDRAQTSQVAGLLQGGYGQALQFAEHQRQLRERLLQEPLFRRQQILNSMNLGLGPVGSTTTQTSTSGSNPWSSALGGAAAGSAFGPWGALIGGGVGLAGGLLS